MGAHTRVDQCCNMGAHTGVDQCCNMGVHRVDQCFNMGAHTRVERIQEWISVTRVDNMGGSAYKSAYKSGSVLL